jgi:hypothetical protein
MSVLELFIDIVDVSDFPATPEDMYRLLEIESEAKREHGLTHRGMNGYVYMKAEEVSLWG